VVKVRGAGGGRVSIAGVACYRPGDRPHLFYQLRAYRRRKGEAKGFTRADYIHLAPELADFAAENKEWLRVCRPRIAGQGVAEGFGISDSVRGVRHICGTGRRSGLC
jgi:hypothetical protein